MTDIVIGGRIFTPANFDRMTSLMECHVMTLMRKCGLDRVLPTADDSDASWLLKISSALVDSGCLHELVAAYLLPAGSGEQDWTRDKATEIARFLEKVDGRGDRERIHELGMEVAFGFFVRGIESLKRSQSALEQLNQAGLQNSQTIQRAAAAAASMPVPGPRSSGWWRGLITRGRKRSPAGRSASS